MKVKDITRCIIKESDLDILGATLLTKEEAEQLPERLKKYDDWWWLKSPSRYSDGAMYVSTSCCISYKGVLSVGKVRPVLVISSLESSGLKIGDTFNFRDKKFEIISNDKAFCLGDIGHCAFRQGLGFNVYEKSSIKRYVDEWFKESIKESNNEDKEKEIDKENEIKKIEKIKEELDRLSKELIEISQAISPRKSHDDVADAYTYIPSNCRFCPSDPRNGGSGCDCVDLNKSYNYSTIVYDPIYNEYYNKSKSTTNTYNKTTFHKFKESIEESDDESQC